jgi:hypothetical protein
MVDGITSIFNLITLLGNSDDRIVHRAASRLGQIGDPAALPDLEIADRSYHEWSKAPSGPVRCAICKAIREVKSR